MKYEKSTISQSNLAKEMLASIYVMVVLLDSYPLSLAAGPNCYVPVVVELDKLYNLYPVRRPY